MFYYEYDGEKNIWYFKRTLIIFNSSKDVVRRNMKMIKEILEEVEKGALEKKGNNIVLLNVANLSDITDYYFIITAQNERQIKAIRNEIEHRLKEKFHIRPKHVEGAPNSKWIVIDYFDFIVHIFEENLRQYYELERLWGDAKVTRV